jgi:uncharacterized protein YutE (UPF0331/DUF86 family)
MNGANERSILETVLPQLEAEGYDVFIQPSPKMLPAFMQGQVPDAIALREGKKLAIEIIREGVEAQKRLQRLQRLFAAHSDWELRVYYVKPASEAVVVEPASRGSIVAAIKTVERFVAEGEMRPALLMAWATFEALGRTLMPEKFQRPQTPGRLIEVLAEGGQITPNEADILRRLARARNNLIHGGLQTVVTKKEMTSFVKALKNLLDLVAPASLAS